MRFQVSFNPFLRELFTFPLRYWCTIGHTGYLALPEGAGSFTRTTTESVLLGIPSPSLTLRVRGSHPLWRRVPAIFHFGYGWACEGPTTPQDLRPCGLGWSPFARHYSGNTGWYLFLRVLRWFTSPGSPPFRDADEVGGLPHSGILGSRPACGYPRLIAACHALHRPSVPRHPPHTLTILTRISPRWYRSKSKACTFVGALWAAPQSADALQHAGLALFH